MTNNLKAFSPKDWKRLDALLKKDDISCFRLVAVLWKDACHSRDDDVGAIHQVTAGILRALTPTGIAVSMDLSEEGAFEETTTILRESVREIYLVGSFTLC